MKLRAVLALALIATSPAAGQAQPAARSVGWSGTFTLPGGTQASTITFVEQAGSAIVSLAPGRTAAQLVRIQAAPGTIRFRLPGRPSDLVFEGRKHGRVISGAVRQGAQRGVFRLAAGARTGEPVLGTYTLSGGDAIELIDLGRLGLPLWAVDLTTGAFHALFRSRSGYDIGGFQARQPVAGRLRVSPTGLSWTQADGSAQTGTRLPVRQQEVSFPSKGAMLAGTLTLPDTPGPHPAVALAHGSGPALRDEGQFYVGILAREGIAVLSYDKRGNGSSSGRYPGEFPTDQAVSAYADDAVAAVRFLARQPDLDHSRIGLVGGSQAGWIIPLAATREPAIGFAVIESGPTVSVGESSDYSTYTSQGNAPLPESLAQINAQVKHDGPSGFDPRPSLRRLRIPILWLFGGLDMNQPTDLDVDALQQLRAQTGADYSWQVFPNGNHGIFQVKTGLNSELEHSPGMPSEFFTTLTDWLHNHYL